MKSASDSESADVLMSIAKHSVTTKARQQCQPVTASGASNLADAQGVEMRDKGHSVHVLRTGDPARSLGVIYDSLLTF